MARNVADVALVHAAITQGAELEVAKIMETSLDKLRAARCAGAVVWIFKWKPRIL
jgi:hypothetical protein